MIDQNLTVYDYYGHNYFAKIEEKQDDILCILNVERYGDTFYLVFTKDAKVFAYGWWSDWVDFCNIIRDRESFKDGAHVGTCIGIAAKDDWSDRQTLICDDILSIWQNGHWYEVNLPDDESKEWDFYDRIPYETVEHDELGYPTYTFSFQQIKNYLKQ